MLQGKIRETQASGNAQIARCQKLIQKTSLVTAANRYCLKGESPALDKMLYWSANLPADSKRGPARGVLGPIEAQLFTSKNAGEVQLKAADRYLEAGYFHHAAAAATLGSASFPEKDGDFKAVLGCSLVRLGLLSEAGFYLKSASGYRGIAGSCLAQIRQLQERL